MEEKRPGPLYPRMMDYIHKYWKEELYLSDDSGTYKDEILRTIKEDLDTYMVFQESELIAGSLRIIMRAYPDTIPGILEILRERMDNEKYLRIADSVIAELRDILHISADPDDFDPRDPRIFLCLMGGLLEETTKALEKLLNEYLYYTIEEDIFGGEDALYYLPYHWDKTPYEISRNFLSVLENSRNMAEVLHIYGDYEEFIDILYRYEERLSLLMEVNGHIAPALLRFLEKSSWSTDMEDIFSKLGGIFIKSDVQREFLRMLVRKICFSSDEFFWKSLYLLKELLEDKEDRVARKSSQLILYHLKKEIEKGTKPEIFTGILGDYASQILKNLSRNDYPISEDDIFLLFEISLDKGKFLAVLVSRTPEPMWARIVLRLLAERKIGIEDLEEAFRSKYGFEPPIGEIIYQAIKKDENADYWIKIYMDFFKDRRYVVLE